MSARDMGLGVGLRSMRIGTTVETVWSNLARFLLLVLAAAAACTSGAPDLEEELRAIEALNQHDVDAVLSSDFDALISQWTEDFVVISPGAVVRGRSANAALLEGARAMSDLLEPVEHVLDFEETIVSGDYAFQWGTLLSSSRSRASGELFSGGGKLMRILQRQADGSWKMHRTMTMGDPGGE
ncbi:MAG: DUF4440 domain-containing protein [Acidobacteria bacterium]|nr:DUF4440 domain-containing protein [Acidobacteriota bacterium]